MKGIVKTLISLLGMVQFFAVLSGNPLPYTGKLSVDGVNFHGRAEFSFAIRDANGTVHWQHAADNSSIRVNVINGRYEVLLGGQGMEPLPAELFLNLPRLFLVISADLGDGRGRMPLKPDQRITSSAHALSADLAERAKVADSVSSGAITGDMLSRALKQEMGESIGVTRLDPAMLEYLTPLLLSLIHI